MTEISSHQLDIESKLALFLSVLGFFILALVPFAGTIPGVMLVTYSFYLCGRVNKRRPNTDVIKASMFVDFSAIAFIMAIVLLFISIVHL